MWSQPADPLRKGCRATRPATGAGDIRTESTMSQNPHRGRVYRRCSCRDANRRQLGPRCPRLAGGTKHGSWSFAVDMPSLGRKRTTMRRSGYPTRKAALAALTRVLECERTGIWLNDTQTVADYLTSWLADKTLTLKPTTIANYTAYLTNNLLPALGAVRLEKLNQFHIARFIHDQLSAGRGPTTLRRCVATLSSALNDAVRHHPLQHNPARFAPLPPATEERTSVLDPDAGRHIPPLLRADRRSAHRPL
jgi:hypothetical protein